MKKKNILKNEKGFTLIEIIAVLVIMGILAAVAIPKFFDLQTKAREKAVYTALSEMKVRVNQYFAQQLLNGKTYGEILYTEAAIAANTGKTFADFVDIGKDFAIKNWNPGNPTDPDISLDIEYYPNPNDHTDNPDTTSGAGKTITKPKAG